MGRPAHKAAIRGGLKTFGAGLVTGVASLTSFAHPVSVPRYPHRSPADALRGDWSRIGRDMQRVVEQENANIEKNKK
jgi:hypothetical protein